MVVIQEERAEDVLAIRHTNEAAFGISEEGRLVDNLRNACGELLSLVAVDGGEVVGHVLFSPATVDGGDVNLR